MTVIELKNELENNANLILVDVREKHEVDICKIDDSIFYPMSSLTSNFHFLPRNKQLVIMCHHGVRSQWVVNFLLGQGFTNVTNLDGGIHQWAISIDQSMKKY